METLLREPYSTLRKVLWGKIVFYEIYEDTEKVKAIDEYLAQQHVSSGTDVYWVM